MNYSESDTQSDLLDTGRRKHRVRTGCFCCRKRKKKCDEAQPACLACVRNRIKCVYPTIENETLPEGFTLKEAAYESIPHRKRRKRKSAEVDPVDDYEQILRKRQSLFNIIIVNPSTPKHQSDLTKSTSELHSVIDTTENTPQWIEVDEILNASASAQSTSDQPLESIQSTSERLQPTSEFDQSNSELESRELQLYSPESPDYPPLESPWNDSPLMSLHNYIPNNLSPQNSELYMIFINHFIPSVSLPHSHPRLAPGHIWVNMGLESKILTDIFLCCGASHMAYAHRVSAISNPYVDQKWALEISDQFEATAELKYRQALKSLGNAIANKEIDIDSDWLFTAGLNLCLRDRSQGLNGSRCAKHLIFVYNLVKRRESSKKLSSIERYQDDRIMALDGSDEVDLVSTNSSPITITPTERLLMDSFVFNYSAALLSCSLQDLVTLPSPYGFFPRMRRWLNQPIYTDCEFIWMNKPVTGCALDSFEICAKLTWLLRLHYQIPFGSQDSEGYQFNEKYYMNDETFWKLVIPIKSEISQVESQLDALELELDAMALRHGSLHSSVEGPRSNLSSAIMMLNSAKIMYEKLIDPSIPAHLPRIQDSVNRVIDELMYVPGSDQQPACLSCLGLFIAGISSINDAQREALIKVFNKMSNELATGVGLNILRVLRDGWEREEMSEGQTYRCFDMLFDRSSIEQIAF